MRCVPILSLVVLAASVYIGLNYEALQQKLTRVWNVVHLFDEDVIAENHRCTCDEFASMPTMIEIEFERFNCSVSFLCMCNSSNGVERIQFASCAPSTLLRRTIRRGPS